jgi:hypothetical protein
MAECRHGREDCEQCRWELREQAKRFHDHLAKNLLLERQAIERRWDHLKGLPYGS